MKIGIQPFVMGNWKMNPQTVSMSVKIAKELKTRLGKVRGVQVVVAPSFVHLEAVSKVRNSSNSFLLGVQNAHSEKLGPYTGEVSIPMLKDFDVSHVIIGHSERRRAGETDKMVNEKLIAALKAGLTAVVCVGEVTRDHNAHYLSFVEMQIRSALAGLSKAKLAQVVIAYEPIWAISSGDGKGKTATPEDAHEMKLFIEKVLSDLYGRNLAQKVRILYGGSVNGKNAKELFVGGAVDGFLVGGASLHPDEFFQIVKAVQPV